MTEREGELKQAVCQPPAVDIEGGQGFPLLSGRYAFVHGHQQLGAQALCIGWILSHTENKSMQGNSNGNLISVSHLLIVKTWGPVSQANVLSSL